MSCPIDREQWSESSKRSYAFHYKSTTYEDIAYKCIKCGTGAVFTADEQKFTYEVKKQYIWRRRVLCPQCNGELYKLREAEKEFQKLWSKERESLKANREFLAKWLAILEAIPTYRQRTRSAMKSKLEKLLKPHATVA